jgi:hypothetical protein
VEIDHREQRFGAAWAGKKDRGPAKGVIVEQDSARQGADPHYGEPAKDDPHYGEGGDEKPDASDQEKDAAIKRAKEQARESGEEASGKTGGESGGMASAD